MRLIKGHEEEKQINIKKKIEQAKADKWKEYINNADDHSIYEIKDYILNSFTSAFVPTLNENAATT